jgi:hypothetical protein
MATIGNGSTSFLNTPRRAYITTAPFQNDIFQYTTTTNPTTFVVTGTLTSLATVGTGTSATCPANRILVENGKKLYPSGLAVANNTTYSAPNPGVTTYMVGVYDPASFLSGFIDPNSKVFAPYNTDKPDYVPRGINPNGNTEVDQGPPVYTLGAVTAGTTVTAGTGIVATTGQVRADTVTALTSYTFSTGAVANVTRNIDPSLGQVFTLTVNVTGGTNSGQLTCTTTPAAGSVVYLIVTTASTHTTAFNITGGTNIKMAQITCGTTADRFFGITLVSDGSKLVQVGGDVAPTALA